MWKADELGARINYAVVVKASKISGRATGSSSAGEVLMQIQQSLNNPYVDSVTTEEQKSHRCWVVSSKAITKEALAAMQGALENYGADRVTTFIDSDRLWELVEQYLGLSTVAGKLCEIQEMLEHASDHHRVVASTASGKVTFSVEPKYPGAEDVEPIVFESTLSFPDTPEGIEMRAAWNHHLKTGAPVKIAQPFLTKLTLPEFLQPFLDPLKNQAHEIVLGPRKSRRPMLAHVHITNQEGTFSLNAIEFRAVQVGEEEFTIDNWHSEVPWHLRLLVNSVDGRIKLSVRFNFEGSTAKRQLEAIRLQSALSKGGLLRVEDLNTGFDFLSSHLEPGMVAAPDSIQIEILESLAFIQARTRTPLSFPPDDINPEDVSKVLSVAQKIRTGYFVLPPAVECSLHMSRLGAEEMLKILQSGDAISLSVAHQVEENAQVFGTYVDLGTAVVVCRNASPDPLALSKLEKALEDDSADDFVLMVTGSESEPFIAYYPQWLPKEELKKLSDELSGVQLDKLG